MTKKIFLGGTCTGPDYRINLIPKLEINYFNPVVDNWNEEAYQNELVQREVCDYTLYYITPYMKGVYSIAEAVDDSNKRPNKVIFFFEEFLNEQTQKSMVAVSKMIKSNGGNYFEKYDEMIRFINNKLV